MEVVRQKIDRDFDRYVLSLQGFRASPVALPNQVLEPLDPAKVLRKAQWEARVHHNALTLDAFQSTSDGTSVAYYVDRDFRLMRIIKDQQNPVKIESIYKLPESNARVENVSLQVAASGLLVYSDGNGLVVILQARDPVNRASDWRMCHKCRPLGDSSTAASLTLLRAYAEENDNSYSVYCLAGKSLEPSNNPEASSYSIMMLECLVDENDMDIDAGAHFQLTPLMETATLPRYSAFSQSAAFVLVEGNHELKAKWIGARGNQHKRHHDDDECKHPEGEALAEEEEEESGVPKMPRAGLGYHGKTPPQRPAAELGIVEGSMPLSERFLKSSTPFSSLEEPVCSASNEISKTSPKNVGALEVPTPDSILGGFEECDDLDPNATALLYRFSCQQHQFTSKLDIDCRNFRFLCASSPTLQSENVHDGHALDRLLFQHDVHGLVFEIDAHQQQHQGSGINAKPSLRLIHSATFPAFGFVQASKQQKKYVSFDALSSAFALIGEFDKRVYLYHGGDYTSQEAQQHIRKQHVVEIGDQQLYGMQIVNRHQVLLLTSNQLVLLDVNHV